MVYLDYAATSYRKPKTVAREMGRALDYYSANPGRSGHRLSAAAAEKLFEAREQAAEFFGEPDCSRVFFYFELHASPQYHYKRGIA